MTKTILDWEWPFSLADVTAGLRRYFEDTSLRVTQIRPKTMPYRRPAIGRVRAMRVEFSTSVGSGTCELVVKEPRGTTRTGLAGAGRREVGVYRSLTGHLPLPTPTLIAASSIGDWLLLEAVQSVRDPSYWEKEDYIAAIEALTRLHDRFWGLETDLNVFQWLSRPIRADFEVHVAAAAKAIERIVNQAQPEPLATVPERMQVLAALTMQADQIVTPLLKQPSTLLHGDYWPGNIAVLKGQKEYRKHEKDGFSTPSGKVELYSSKLKDWGFDPLPTYHEPPETPLSAPELVKEYPLVFTSWKEGVFRHSCGRQITSLRDTHPEPVVWLHPDTAGKQGIADGDSVYIETKRGRIRQKALLTRDIDPRVVGVDYAWWFPENGPDKFYGWAEANLNILTDDSPPFGREMGTANLRGILCKIQKA